MKSGILHQNQPLHLLLVFLFVCGVSCPPLWSEPCKAIVLKTMQYVADSMGEFMGICPISCSVPLEPHLVVSEWGNETLLVCALNKDIVGHCVEYNSGSKTIQEHVKCEPCTEFSIPCPFHYDSRESFKFRDCFTRCGGIKSSKDIYEKQQNTSQQLENAKKMLKEKDKENEDLKADNALLLTTVIVLSVVLVLMVAFGLRFLYLTKLRKDKLHKTVVEKDDDEENEDETELSELLTPENADIDGIILHETNEENTEHGEISESNNQTNNRGEAEVDVHDAVENNQQNISLNEIEKSLEPVDMYHN